MGRTQVRRGSLLLVGLVGVLLAACTPVPAGPTWSTASWPRVDSPAALVDRAGAWTDGTWFATVRTTTVGGTPTKALEVAKRAASNPLVLGPSQQLPLPGVSDFLVVGESFLGVQVGQAVRFFRPDATGTWAAAGEVAIPAGTLLGDLTDEWMAVRRPGGTLVDGEVQLFSVDATGATVTADYVTTLTSNASSFCTTAGFGGTGVRLDGSLLAVGVGTYSCSPSTVRSVDLFRLVGGTWQLVQQFEDATGHIGYAASFDVDDQSAVDRLVIGSQLGVYQQAGTAPQVEIFEDAGNGFGLVQTLLPDPAVPAFLTTSFGSHVAVSGRVLGTTTRFEVVPPSEPGQPEGRGQYVAAYVRSTAGVWTRETEKPVFLSPTPAGTLGSVPLVLSVARSTIAVANFVPLVQAPCVGCFSAGAEAWFVDRFPD